MTRFVFLIALAALLLGCATTQRVDWNSRIGSYTYDDAILEMGVPDRSATLTDGTLVAEWLVRRGETYGNVHGFRYSPFMTYDIDQFPDRYVRLIFTPEMLLNRVEYFAK